MSKRITNQAIQKGLKRTVSKVAPPKPAPVVVESKPTAPVADKKPKPKGKSAPKQKVATPKAKFKVGDSVWVGEKCGVVDKEILGQKYGVLFIDGTEAKVEESDLDKATKSEFNQAEKASKQAEKYAQSTKKGHRREAIRHLEAFVRLAKKATQEKLVAALKSLQLAITTRKIHKTDAAADSILYVQKSYLDVLNNGKAPYQLSVPENKLNKIIMEAGGEVVFKSVQAAKYLWRFIGKTITQKQVKNIAAYVNKLKIEQDEPYADLVKEVLSDLTAIGLKNAKKSNDNDTFVFDIKPEVALSGLNGLMGLSGLGCGCETTGLSGMADAFSRPPARFNAPPPTPTPPPVLPVVPPVRTAMPAKIPDLLSSSDLMNFNYATYQFDGVFKRLIGNPQTNFVLQIWGMPGQGKSTFAMQLSRYLARVHGPVLFVSSEEYPSYTLMEKIKRVGGAVAGWDFAKDLSKLTATHKFLVIDSVNHLGWTLDQLKHLKNKRPDLGIILIMQATKGGQFRGGQDWGHEVDAVIKVENGKAFTEKNRFQALSQIAIF